MKSVRSDGGPFIIIDGALAPSWGGTMHKYFMDDAYDGENDYDALCNMLNLPEYTRREMVALNTRVGQALILGMPFEATIILNDPARACIVQAHYSDPEWSAENLDRSVLDLPDQQDSDFAEMSFNGGDLVIFDSACDYNYAQGSMVNLILTNGIINAKYSIQHPDDRTMMSVTDLRVR